MIRAKTDVNIIEPTKGHFFTFGSSTALLLTFFDFCNVWMYIHTVEGNRHELYTPEVSLSSFLNGATRTHGWHFLLFWSKIWRRWCLLGQSLSASSYTLNCNISDCQSQALLSSMCEGFFYSFQNGFLTTAEEKLHFNHYFNGYEVKNLITYFNIIFLMCDYVVWDILLSNL